MRNNDQEALTRLGGGDKDDFGGGRIPTEVHYESDSGEMCEIKVDLIGDDVLERRSSRSVSKRDKDLKLAMRKQKSGGDLTKHRKRGLTPP